ncbi:MAG: ABC transporter ATP-binding protein/permease [Pegethrix bostrychoides GSE-TBD4-15B]|jgi:ATP-binding cassette subfamily B protein|uniref:ABC transporter ATP-binding protein/permease n=1 Tax=Pegethrix bostrychoides GSE-TBD4-15B TaxID=2839662 RepID=A0A951U403_9CYAN|nr:ABC transporter ATP-binding protein/permease [Pegethrix bostrychoides GSE-TBD4-15B]
MKHTASVKETLPGMGRILKRFAPQIQKQRSLLIVSFLALLAETLLRLLEPWPLKIIFDYILLPGVNQTAITLPLLGTVSPILLLTLLTISSIGLAVLRGAAAYSSTAGMAVAASHVMTEIRGDLYGHLQRLSMSFHNQAKTGDLIARVTQDITRLREVTVMALLPLLASSLTLVGMVGVMFWLHWEMAVIAIAIFPLFVISTTRTSRQIREVVRRQRKREGAMAATAAEAMGAIKVVQALSLQNLLEDTFSRQNRKSLQDDASAQKLSAGMERTMEVLVTVAVALVLWKGVQLVLQGTITPGDLLIFITYLKTAFKPIRQLAKYTGQIAKATASGERVIDVLDTIPDIQDTRGALEASPFAGAVQFERVSFAYDTEIEAGGRLHNISFTVSPGQRVALVGPSGSGKSTLISLLLRFYDPIEGRILIDGHDIREYKVDSLRRQISVVLQESILFAATVRENIAYGRLGATQAEIEAAAQLANAHEFILKLPQGYDTVLGERGATLSGGQRQRIAIARAAIRHSPIVILDEPTTGLDNHSEQTVNEALERLTQGCTTFTVSHNLRITEQADWILYVEDGEILEQGTHPDLMRLKGRYAKLYQLQSNVYSIESKRSADHSHPNNGGNNALVI